MSFLRSRDIPLWKRMSYSSFSTSAGYKGKLFSSGYSSFYAPLTCRFLFLLITLGSGYFIFQTKQIYDSYRLEQTHLLYDVPFHVFFLKLLPLKSFSSFVGILGNLTLPRFLRAPIYNFYALCTGVNLTEIRDSLITYPSFNSFFSRRLKDGLRTIDPEAQLVAPSDGKILACGRVSLDHFVYKEKTLQQETVSTNKKNSSSAVPGDHPLDNIIISKVKGFRFPVSQFLGEYTPSSDADIKEHVLVDVDISSSYSSEEGHFENVARPPQSSPASDVHGLLPSNNSKSFLPSYTSPISFLSPIPKSLHYCLIYLAPGNYHRFHSPTEWIMSSIRHIYGEHFPVAPWFIEKIERNVYVLNTRVPLIGEWAYGRFSMTPVGSTSVGKIKVYGDLDVPTNQPIVEPWKANMNIEVEKAKLIKRGTEMGYFEMGSTIVLIFEAPENFSFTVNEGDYIKVGQPIGTVNSN